MTEAEGPGKLNNIFQNSITAFSFKIPTLHTQDVRLQDLSQALFVGMYRTEWSRNREGRIGARPGLRDS